MTFLMDTSRICLEEQLLIKDCVIKHLILLKIQNILDIKGVLFQWFICFFDKKPLVVLLKMKLCQTKN